VIGRVINALLRRGAEVLWEDVAFVHVSGHASQDDLRHMLELTRPRYFVPVHGEFRRLWMHSTLAHSMGIPEENIFTMEDGDILEIDKKGARLAGHTSADFVYVDGLAVGVDRVVLRDRKHLAGDGVIVAIVTIDRHTGKPIGRPDVVSRGFIEAEMSDGLMEKARDVIIDALCMNLVVKPQQYQMIVLPNLYGDIVSDLAAGLVGGLGFAPSANIGKHISIFEAVHGSAPDIAGRGIANPVAAIWAGAMMLDHVGERDAHDRILAAIGRVLQAGEVRTPDLGGRAGTDEMAAAIRAAL
jgi:hypothetical protein